ncbi:Protein of unknown function [Pyronema omphalodes CBS 100304]|uniref:Uncharacterized protein n=1 Tax=Pyronema omphalodes (strain CBS 100304) TaxID=1076935 RepID=U4LVS8_PYROM|nr:Protein of unknown function [Pyronema omphalodes CBS 100304]
MSDNPYLLSGLQEARDMTVTEAAEVFEAVETTGPVKKAPKRRKAAARYSTPKARKAAAARKARAKMIPEGPVQAVDQLIEEPEDPNGTAEHMDDHELNENPGPGGDIETIGLTEPLQTVGSVEPEQLKGHKSRKDPQPKTPNADATPKVASTRNLKEPVGVIEPVQPTGLNGLHDSVSLTGPGALNKINGTQTIHGIDKLNGTGELCGPSEIYGAERFYTPDEQNAPSDSANLIESTGHIAPDEQLAYPAAPSVSTIRKSSRKPAPRKVMTANNLPKTVAPAPRKISKKPSAPKAAHAEELARVYQEVYSDGHAANGIDDDIQGIEAEPYPSEVREEIKKLLRLEEDKAKVDKEIEDRFSHNPEDYQAFEAKCYQAQAALPNKFCKEFNGSIAPGSHEDSALTFLWGIQSNAVPMKRRR